MTDILSPGKKTHPVVKMKQGKVLAVITARGGSKGLPRKNVLPCGGQPLIAWAIGAVRASRLVDRLVVSTDDAEIAAVSREYGAEVPFMRPSELAGDASPHVLAVQHAVKWLEEHAGESYEYVALVQPTSPLMTAEDVDGAIRGALDNGADSVITIHEAKEHPYYMRVMAADGCVDYMMEEGFGVGRRQELPAAYAQGGAVFVIRTAVMFRDNVLETKRPHAYVMPPERSLDVDTWWDFKLADLLLSAVKVPKS